MTTMTEISDAFELGWMHIRQLDKDEFQKEVMQYFDVTSYPAWLRRLRGEVPLDRNQAKDIEVIFRKYGVETSKIWGRYES